MRSLLNGGTPSLKYMPIGISKLTSLRTLEKFAVGGGVNDISTCRLESLKNLQLLRECGIEGLSNVSHLDEDERLGLHNMKNLLRLSLEFDVEGEEGRRKNQQLLEALQPPLNVKELGIVSYGGNIFPKWLTSLTNLRDLRLKSCVICEHFPPLGKLPLEKLTLYGLYGVKRVGNEFLGIEGSSEDDPSSSSSSSSVIAFPKLKSLHVGAMEELEEWNYRITRKENISIMPRLSSLTIWHCPRLRVLPDYLFQSTTLQKLSISYCPIMEELPILEDHRTTDIPRLSSLEIEYCPKLKVLPDYLLRTTTLQQLSIQGCPLLENRYREGKGEDWHRISHIPHIEWDSRKCQNYTSNSQVDFENSMEDIGVTKDYHCGYCATFGCWTLKKEALKSYKAKHLWADHMFQLRKELGVGNIVQVIVVCKVSSLRIRKRLRSNLSCHHLLQLLIHSRVDFEYPVEDIPETKD
ncbi:hypothetical protein WN944_006427 [Citrus x changshan-huyou]|uniref:R13L1/DRL21-like LRR repeat region domain-containing protein n=1 Tax=Citrus x changshan-huyou TaxID=2935761 RepID=A0AAP0MQL3_9ROSI